jgi:selenium-binding protein 1
VWNLHRREIVRTITVPGAGTIDVKLIPHDRQRRGFTAAMMDDHLYLLDTQRGTADPVFDFSTIAVGAWPQLMRITENGRRLLISLNQAGKVLMLDISQPQRPKLAATLDLGPSSGPHYLALTHDEKRLIISDYFLNEDGLGKVHAEGDHRIHVANVTDDGLDLDTRFHLDFNTAFATGPARPHGIAIR